MSLPLVTEWALFGWVVDSLKDQNMFIGVFESSKYYLHAVSTEEKWKFTNWAKFWENLILKFKVP